MGNEIILVIGNGYDLQCNVKSKFSDYFDARVANNKEIFDLISKNIQKVNDLQRAGHSSGFVRVEAFGQAIRTLENHDLSFINFWDLYFLDLQIHSSDPNWSDVENEIASFILGLKWNGSTHDYFSKLGLRVSPEENVINSNGLNYVYFSELVRMIFKNETSNNALYEISRIKYSNAVTRKNFETYYQFLLSELNRFELEFQIYLINQLSANQEMYRQRSCKLYDLITENINKENIYLMNFNYTLPTVNLGPRRGANVHGFIGYGEDFQKDSIIIGVDLSSDKIEDDQSNHNIHMFTKTFRKLNHKISLTTLKWPNKGDVRKIIFYGHSLSKADYSYFQSLFDYYDLYDSDVTLEFMFSQYPGKTKEEIEYEYKSRVHKLIQGYGSSMDNKDRGKNLLHKLLLEHRVQIREIQLQDSTHENRAS